APSGGAATFGGFALSVAAAAFVGLLVTSSMAPSQLLWNCVSAGRVYRVRTGGRPSSVHSSPSLCSFACGRRAGARLSLLPPPGLASRGRPVAVERLVEPLGLPQTDDALKDRAVEIRLRQIGAGQDGAREVGARQVGAQQAGAGKIGAGE